MKEVEEEKWKLENYSSEYLVGARIYYTKKRLFDILIGFLDGDTNQIREAKIININKNRDCIKIYREENDFEDWVAVSRISVDKIVKENKK